MEFYDYTFKVLLLANSEVDKSAMIWRNIPQPDERLTIGVEFTTKILVIDNKKYKIQIWDFILEERFRFLLPQYCPGANAAVLLYDVTRSQTLDNIGEWTDIIRQTSGNIPIMLVGIIYDEKSERQISTEEGKKIAKSRNINEFIECNVSSGENVEKTFEALTSLILASNGDFFLEKEKRSSPKTHSEPSLRPSPYPKQPRDPDWESMGAIMDTIRALSDLSSKQNRIDLDSQLGPTGGNSKASVRVNINPQLKGEILSFLEWIKDSEGLSGYINYYLQQNTPSIISELSKIYSELRQIIEKSLESSKSFNFNDSENNGDKNYDGDDYLPHPFIFIHPRPPNDFEPAPQSQLRAPLKENNSKDESICQYCGRKLSKEEQFTHSCNRFFLG